MSDKFSTLITISAIAESLSTLWIHLDLHVQKCSIRLLAKGCENIVVSERLALKTANRWTQVPALSEPDVLKGWGERQRVITMTPMTTLVLAGGYWAEL